jgi:hypothetical protein
VSWSRCDDLTPEKSGVYLGFFPDAEADEQRWPAEFWEGHGWYDADGARSVDGLITHWRPMPEPPSDG